MLARRTIESEFGIFYTADRNRLNDETRLAPDLLGRAKLEIADTRVQKDPDAGEPRYRLLQELNLLAAEFRSIEEQAGEVPARTADTSRPPVRHGSLSRSIASLTGRDARVHTNHQSTCVAG